jgi:hypothetical protein
MVPRNVTPVSRTQIGTKIPRVRGLSLEFEPLRKRKCSASDPTSGKTLSGKKTKSSNVECSSESDRTKELTLKLGIQQTRSSAQATCESSSIEKTVSVQALPGIQQRRPSDQATCESSIRKQSPSQAQAFIEGQ